MTFPSLRAIAFLLATCNVELKLGDYQRSLNAPFANNKNDVNNSKGEENTWNDPVYNQCYHYEDFPRVSFSRRRQRYIGP